MLRTLLQSLARQHMGHQANSQQQPQQLLLPLLQQLAPPPALCGPSSASQQQQQHSLSAWPAHTQQQHQQQQRCFSSRLNPKEQKAKAKTNKKAAKKAAGVGAADSAASFSDEVQAMEPDMTRLVLQALHNVTPILDVRTVRSATTVSYVPGLMPPRKARSLALHWLVKAADARSAGSKARYAECLALELLLAYQKRGAARQKRDDLHKLALQNRANIHLRWW